MAVIGSVFGWVMRLCYQLAQNYGLAILLFALVSKVVLFPLALWVHANGIKLVRLQPAINRLKVKYFGDKDSIAEEQMKLYKQEKYSPFAGLVPILVQLLFLLGLVQVIYHPLSYILSVPAPALQAILQAAGGLGGIDTGASSAELLALNWLQTAPGSAALASIAGVTPELLASIGALKMSFLGFNLAAVPIEQGGALLVIPLAAAASSILLSLSQNIANPLQAQQSKWEQLGSMGLSVALALVLGFFIPAGVGFYWVCSNLASILQQYLLNWVYRPARHIDYAALEASKKELEKYASVGKARGKRTKEQIKREKQDYKRFFSILNKHIVFYSESNGFYKYFENAIQWLLRNSSLTLHYITSDPDDKIFEMTREQPRIKAYYIGERKLITLFMKLEADVMVMTLSDLGNYQYKRSYLSNDIEYVYLFHYPLSTHMVLHTGALDHYDTILCVGDFQFAEIRKTEALSHLPAKKLVRCGYGLLENLYRAYQALPRTERAAPKVLIAPSWQPDNILDSCLDELLKALLGQGFDVTVRPHPEYVKRYGARMEEIVSRYAAYPGTDLHFELDFSGNQSIFDSDIAITDWSGTAYEFSFVTERPCVFVDTPPKINNPDYVKLGIEPLELQLRDQIGIRVDPRHMEGLADRLRLLLTDESWRATIAAIRDRYIANFGSSGEVAGRYLLEAVRQHIQQRKQQERSSAPQE